MQCPKCGYEPTMAEMQSNPGQCASCGIVYEQYDGQAHAAERRARRRPWLLSAVGLFAVVALIVGGFKFYAHRQAIEQIDMQVKLATAYVEQMTAVSSGAASMTFGELFSKADRFIAEIDSALVKVSIVEPRLAEAEAARAYMKAGQEVIRNISGSARSMMEFGNAKDREERANEDAMSSNSYRRERASETKLKALDDQIKALDSLKAKQEALRASAKVMLTAQGSLGALSASSLLSQDLQARLLSEK